MLLPSNLQKSPIYQSRYTNSTKCLNLDIEWTSEYFAQIRQAFKTPHQFKFILTLPQQPTQKALSLTQQLDRLMPGAAEESPRLEVYFQTSKKAQVLIFQADLKVTSVSDTVDVFTSKLCQFVNAKNTHLQELQSEIARRDAVIADLRE